MQKYLFLWNMDGWNLSSHNTSRLLCLAAIQQFDKTVRTSVSSATDNSIFQILEKITFGITFNYSTDFSTTPNLCPENPNCIARVKFLIMLVFFKAPLRSTLGSLSSVKSKSIRLRLKLLYTLPHSRLSIDLRYRHWENLQQLEQQGKNKKQEGFIFRSLCDTDLYLHLLFCCWSPARRRILHFLSHCNPLANLSVYLGSGNPPPPHKVAAKARFLANREI